MTGAGFPSRLLLRLVLAIKSAFSADRRFLIFVIIVFVNGVLLGPFLPFLGIFVRDELGADQAIAGNYRALTAIPMGFTGLFAAVASDRLGPKPSLVVGLLATVAAACVFLVASEWLLILLAVLHGAGHGFVTVGGITYLVRAARARQAGAASAVYFLGNTMGSAVGAAAGGAILDATSFETLGRIMLGASLAMTVAALIWLPRIAPAQVARVSLSEMLTGYARMLRRGYIWPFIAIELLRIIFWATGSLAMPFVVATLTGSNALAGYFAGLSLLAGMVGMLVAGPVSDRLGRKHIFIGLLVSMTLASTVLGLTTGSAAAFFVMGIFATGVAWALAGQIPAVVKDIATPDEAGRMMGLSLFPTAMGILIGAQLHGQLTESHTSFAFLLLAALLAIAVPAAVMLFRRSTPIGPENADAASEA